MNISRLLSGAYPALVLSAALMAGATTVQGTAEQTSVQSPDPTPINEHPLSMASEPGLCSKLDAFTLTNGADSCPEGELKYLTLASAGSHERGLASELSSFTLNR